MTYILAIMLMVAGSTSAPLLIAPFPSRDDCMEAAIAGAKNDDRLKHPSMVAQQAEYVCLKVERITI